MTEAARYLFDANAFIALIDENHIHHEPITEWFNVPGRQWALCPFAEAGFLRHSTRPGTGNMLMKDATSLLDGMAQHPGYHYQPITADWHTLVGPFFKRLLGHNQITDAYLLGVAVHEGLVLVTFDRAMLHLAGEHRKHVLILEAK